MRQTSNCSLIRHVPQDFQVLVKIPPARILKTLVGKRLVVRVNPSMSQLLTVRSVLVSLTVSITELILVINSNVHGEREL